MIVIAPDKFKGTLSASGAAEAIAAGLRDSGYTGPLQLCPMADGGDGTAAVLTPLLDKDCIVVESHASIGPECFQGVAPMMRGSHAFGQAIAAALAGKRRVYAAIGGTACCDGGAGMLQALGMRAFRSDGSEIVEPLSPGTLPQVARVDFSDLRGKGSIVALSDVRAALTPAPGRLSALDFAAQKGFSDTEIHSLASILSHWRRLCSCAHDTAIDGAGGGIGFGLAGVLGAKVASGADFVLDRYCIDFSAASLIITGEGCIDAQTGSGKAVDAVRLRAEAAGVPVLAVGGKVLGTHPFPTLAVSPPDAPLPRSSDEAAARLREAIKRHLNFRQT